MKNFNSRDFIFIFRVSSMQKIEYPLSTEYVELCHLLKLVGIANSGGEGKLFVANGEVTVDGKPESRKTAKMRVGQVVTCFDTEITIVAA